MSGDTSQSTGVVRHNAEGESNAKGSDKAQSASESAGDANPYIPRFISKAPWYLNSTSDLQHQRLTGTEKARLDSTSRRGVTPHVAIKYRKNACENCGALTHDAKSCVERPRKKGAKYTSADICPDEYIIQNTDTGYDASRDRWAGFDPESHRLFVEAHQAIEEAEERRNMQKLASDLLAKASEGDGGGDKADEACSREVIFDTKDDNTRTTVRNLRIRDDTAKYLINLDIDSAYYDPKSRSLRDDPLIGMENTGLHTFRGDNEVFTSGDAKKPKEIEMFAWEAQQKGIEVQYMAQPTELEFMFKEHREKRDKEKEAKRKALLERFGGSEFLGGNKDVAEPPTSKAQDSKSADTTSDTVRVTISSSYAEDVHTLGHNSVWGSFYDSVHKLWGYKCCKSTDRYKPCPLI
ncbi:putative mRNA processing-related protein [Babesia divergens]|uniref:Pre-mRNA-splicing factor SLU7 n=1 Tax=Babesia divergens TaxID=32595 RepID=A0AAD9GHE8_BABDI|nr:putative mRNA processing-related protein [Babesia divergens]